MLRESIMHGTEEPNVHAHPADRLPFILLPLTLSLLSVHSINFLTIEDSGIRKNLLWSNAICQSDLTKTVTVQMYNNQEFARILTEEKISMSIDMKGLVSHAPSAFKHV